MIVFCDTAIKLQAVSTQAIPIKTGNSYQNRQFLSKQEIPIKTGNSYQNRQFLSTQTVPVNFK
jgi:uncharacterized HAD superfamily protein